MGWMDDEAPGAPRERGGRVTSASGTTQRVLARGDTWACAVRQDCPSDRQMGRLADQADQEPPVTGERTCFLTGGDLGAQPVSVPDLR